MRIVSTRELYAYALQHPMLGAIRLPNNHIVSAIDGGYRFVDEHGEGYRWEETLEATLNLTDRLLAIGG